MGHYMQAAATVVLCQQKWTNPMKIAKSSYKQLNSCFVASALFHKVY